MFRVNLLTKEDCLLCLMHYDLTLQMFDNITFFYRGLSLNIVVNLAISNISSNSVVLVVFVSGRAELN